MGTEIFGLSVLESLLYAGFSFFHFSRNQEGPMP
jgi:hypothetical protein